MIGRTLSHYEVLEKIGSGGMGEVFRARDTRLGRDVAIKVLSADVVADANRRRRFEQEARAASALNHPNIVHIYEIGEDEGTPFIAMEYIEGVTLRELFSSGALAPKKMLELAVQIAQGLAKAHAADIVHRDLKPENLMLTTDGHVKILDFGLAKLLSPAQSDPDGPTFTKHGTDPGTVMGTASYMSPEQTLGKSLDARTDVFSFGVVLYEMATGDAPFRGDTPASLFDEILHKAPRLPSQPLPTSVDPIIHKALQKEPDDRYPSAKEFLADLEAVSSGSDLGRDEQQSIVVLPFENVSADPEQEYFCVGITDEIIGDLSDIQSLRVISRTSSMQLKGTNKSIKTIGEELNVQYVLEGSVRKAGNNPRITARLIDSRNDTNRWSERYSGTLDDVFDVQQKLSRSIVDALEIKLSPEENRKIAEQPFDNIEAYDCYQRARLEIWRGSADGMDRALRDLEVGLEIVGENVLFYAGMAEVHLQRYEWGFSTNLASAEAFTKKVRSLQPESAIGYNLLGRLERFRGSILEAAKYFESALAVDPNHVNSWLFLGLVYALHLGKPSRARPLLTKVVEVDPLTPFSLLIFGLLQWTEGKLDAALATARKVLKLEPEATAAWLLIVYVLASQKKYSEVTSAVAEMAKQGQRDPFTEVSAFFERGLHQKTASETTVLSEETRSFLWNDPESRWFVAGSYALHNNKDEALRWLEHTVKRDWINYPLLKNDPLMENVRGEPRYQELMAVVKEKWENFGD